MLRALKRTLEYKVSSQQLKIGTIEIQLVIMMWSDGRMQKHVFNLVTCACMEICSDVSICELI